jgi:hypothetical protein
MTVRLPEEIPFSLLDQFPVLLCGLVFVYHLALFRYHVCTLVM